MGWGGRCFRSSHAGQACIPPPTPLSAMQPDKMSVPEVSCCTTQHKRPISKSTATGHEPATSSWGQPLTTHCIHNCSACLPGNTGTILGKSPQRCITTDDRSTERCSICLEDVLWHEMHSVGSCQHRFCMSCLDSHIQTQLKGKCYPIPCPQPSCMNSISYKECSLLLSSRQDKQLLDQVAAEASIPAASKVYCPNPACNMPLLRDDRGPQSC